MEAKFEQRNWLAPNADAPVELLKLYNSAVDEKVPFVPINGVDSKSISWYTCGPTVYDVSHLGHARNYVTFDIVRRVLEDYFGYSIFYVMNITDVDDKIILRARRNYLFDKFMKEARSTEQLLVVAATAIEEVVAKQVRTRAGPCELTIQDVSCQPRANLVPVSCCMAMCTVLAPQNAALPCSLGMYRMCPCAAYTC